MRKPSFWLVALTLALFASLAGAQGGVFAPSVDYFVTGQWVFGRSSDPVCFEGSADDSFESCITQTNPTGDRTWTLGDSSDTFVGRATTDTLTNKTLTAPSLTAPLMTIPLFTEFTEAVTATNSIAAAESGSTFFLNSATEFVSTLPAPAAGLWYRFVVMAAPASASYTVVTTTSANVIIGKAMVIADAAGDSGATDDTITFVDGQAVAGDQCEVFSNGTSWFAQCIAAVAAGVTFTTAS